jgi:hypothetical protein
MSNLSSIYLKAQKRGFHDSYMKVRGDKNSKRSRNRGIPKTKAKRFLDKLIEKDFLDYGI